MTRTEPASVAFTPRISRKPWSRPVTRPKHGGYSKTHRTQTAPGSKTGFISSPEPCAMRLPMRIAEPLHNGGRLAEAAGHERCGMAEAVAGVRGHRGRRAAAPARRAQRTDRPGLRRGRVRRPGHAARRPHGPVPKPARGHGLDPVATGRPRSDA